MDKKIIACIGSREITPNQDKILSDIGAMVVSKGFKLHTGNADGSDQSFARGGNSVDPRLVCLFLPWPDYNRNARHPDNEITYNPSPEWFSKTAVFHPKWESLSQGARRLMARNFGIIQGCSAVIALPNKNKIGGGGTGQGIRIAKELGIPVLDINGKSFEEIEKEMNVL